MNMEFCSLWKLILFASSMKAVKYDKLRLEVMYPLAHIYIHTIYYWLIQKKQGQKKKKSSRNSGQQ